MELRYFQYFHRNRLLQRAVIDLGTFLVFLQCFFPQNVVANVQTPTFILNTAYDVWQVCSYPYRYTVDIIWHCNDKSRPVFHCRSTANMVVEFNIHMIWNSLFLLYILKIYDFIDDYKTADNCYLSSHTFQLQQSLAPTRADPHGFWKACKLNHLNCNAGQIRFLQSTTLFHSLWWLVLIDFHPLQHISLNFLTFRISESDA